MKKSLMVVAGMMLGIVLFAQEKGDSHKRESHESMKTVLSLDESQDAAFQEINKKYAEQYKVLRSDSTQAREEKHKALRALHEQREKEISALLTPEQNAKLKAHKEQRAAQRKERMQKARERHDAKLKSELSLTDQQASDIKTARKEFGEKAAALRKSGKKDKAEFGKLKEAHDAKIKSILSAEQFQKWNAMKKEGKRKHPRNKK